MATPTIYRSTDSSAPIITGEVSKLRLALNAILVDGYGSQAAAGWTKAYEDSGNHLVAYRTGSGLQRYLYLNDAPTQVSELRGFGSMTSIVTDTATNPFPRLAVATVKCRKSVTANSTARPWICLATNNTFYLIIFGNQTTFGLFDGGDAHLAFGELQNSFIADSKFLSFILGAVDTSTTSTAALTTRQAFNSNANNNSNAPAGYVEGSYAQVAWPQRFIQLGITPWNETVSGGTTFPTYPDPSTGKLLISRFIAQVDDAWYSLGYLPGIWLVCHPLASFTSMDTFSGSGTLSGRTFLIVKTGAGAVVFETGANW